MELTFLAEAPRDASSDRREHRKASSFDPSSGMRSWGAVQRRGAVLGAAPRTPGEAEQETLAGVPDEGVSRASAGRGVRDGAPGNDHRDAALVAYARPMVNQGTPSVPSDARDKPTDNVDSEQEVATRMQSILHASNAGGRIGEGAGGENGPATAGAGGAGGPGSVSRALGTGQGAGVDSDPRDKRRQEYLRRVMTKLGPYTDWRKLISVAAASEGVQGIVEVSFTIQADGSITGVALSRSSGVPELDANYRAAILKAAPFPPLPPELGTSFRWALPLDLRNPVVRPRDPSKHAER
jgi:TonB family protein